MRQPAVLRIVVSDFPAPSDGDRAFQLNRPGERVDHVGAKARACEVFEANGRSRYVFLQHNQVFAGPAGMWVTYLTVLPDAARAAFVAADDARIAAACVPPPPKPARRKAVRS